MNWTQGIRLLRKDLLAGWSRPPRTAEVHRKQDMSWTCPDCRVRHETIIGSDAEPGEIVDVNCRANLSLARMAAESMTRRGRGGILLMSSLAGFQGSPYVAVYGATKAGIIALTQNIAITYGPDGIRANAICPGDVDTELNQAFFRAHPDPVEFRRRLEREYPLRRIASPEEVARVALFLASDDASFVSGSQVVVDGALMARIYEL